MTVFSVALDCVINGVERPMTSTLFPQVPVPKLFILLSPGSSLAGINRRMAFKDLTKKAPSPTTPAQLESKSLTVSYWRLMPCRGVGQARACLDWPLGRLISA